MIRAFSSEWIKLRRPTLFFGTYAGLSVAASLFSVLLFTQAPAHGQGGGLPSLVDLAKPNGLIHGTTRAAVLLGIVAFGIAASQVALEYSLGTLRQQLVRQPKRLVFLGGKYLAVISFLVGAVAVASIIAGGASVVMAGARHVPTAAWFSSTGLGDLCRALLNLLLATIGFGTLGIAVGLIFRSAVAAIITGFAFLLPVEAIVTRIAPNTALWLPGQQLEAVASGGNGTESFGRALLMSALYALLALVVSGWLMLSRDVTA